MIVSILTVSDRSSQGLREDKSGPQLCAFLENQNHHIGKYTIVPDDISEIKKVLVEWADQDKPDLIITTGGTGFAPRDVTPEATQAILDKLAPGISEYIRYQSMKITPHAMLSRGISGIRNQTLIINLPGSPKAARESLEFILTALPHAIELLKDSPGSENNH